MANTATANSGGHAAYFQITAKVEEVNDASFERTQADGTVEIVHRIQFSLVVPGMRDRVLCELPEEQAPTTDQMEQWELEESWVVVSAGGMRALGFARSNARAGEKAVGALVVFQAAAIREASGEERKALQEARRAQKIKAKQARAARQAEKKQAREAEQAAKGAPIAQAAQVA
jgi:hypothetical protein